MTPPPASGTETFDADVLAPVRTYLGRRVQVPSKAGKWWAEPQSNRVTLHLEIDADRLSRDFQTDVAAAPSFLVCLAYWLERATTGKNVTAAIRVTGEPPAKNEPGWLHWNRTAFLLDQYQRVLGGRLEVRTPAPWSWPASPILNVANGDRPTRTANTNREHLLETYLCRPEARPALCAAIGPIGVVERQLPVGLFDGGLSADARWTPGGKSQVDLWATSEDRRTVHLFELKAAGNMPLGVLPEAFYYARLLQQVRRGAPDGTRITGASPALEAIRAAERLTMWLVAPKIHPLVCCRGQSPLAWLNQRTNDDGVELRVLPIEIGDGDGGVSRWRVDQRWPSS